MAKGHCLCKTVEITTNVEPKASVACSCTSCQACSGSIFTINLVYPKGSVEITQGKDHVKVYKDRADSGNDALRNFCDNCGNAIYTETVDGTLFVKGPVMDGLRTDPVAHIFTKNLPSWADGVKTGDKKKGGS